MLAEIFMLRLEAQARTIGSNGSGSKHAADRGSLTSSLVSVASWHITAITAIYLRDEHLCV
jgi:hypothetical protein